ncbi:hypothetical protein AB0O75_37015 [Streptomyces sp. NPDC088921]|uniref:hypothetical protein n=1 Tax=unclassified Streptomyces TaxID=2593676 RepID=UPI00343F8AC6
MTYKADIADDRESPARPIARKPRARGARPAHHDPPRIRTAGGAGSAEGLGEYGLVSCPDFRTLRS